MNTRITTGLSGANLDRDFLGLNVVSSTGDAHGGAIYNPIDATIADITGNFMGNYASSALSCAMYGNENFTMLMAGVANKLGYNFEFKNGKLIIQPSLLMSYTFLNTFDYNNAAGVSINSNPLNAIQIASGVKPYIGVNMIWNILDKTSVTANDVALPQMSIDPYVQYGVGFQKIFKNNNKAYLQAMVQNGGRNGIALSFGFRLTVGKK